MGLTNGLLYPISGADFGEPHRRWKRQLEADAKAAAPLPRWLFECDNHEACGGRFHVLSALQQPEEQPCPRHMCYGVGTWRFVRRMEPGESLDRT